MINKLKLLIHDIYWACQLPFLKKKYTFEFDEEAFNDDYQKKQNNIQNEIIKILSSFDEKNDNSENENENVKKSFILEYLKKNNIKTYKLYYNNIVQTNLHLYQGFIPKNKGLWSFVLNIILLLNGNKVNLNFENDDLILYDDFSEYHVFIYKLYTYLQYKNKYPFINEKKNIKFIKLLTKSNRNILNGLSMKEIKILEKLILYEKEALGFSIGILRNNANIYEEANQNDK